jgi:methionine-rich copper-binding protein CopC/putative copper export protein
MQSGGRAKPVRLLCGVATAALVAAVLLLATADNASAHAVPLHIEPPPGATLATVPSAVYVTFDSPVRVGPRNAAVRNDGVDVLAGKPRVMSGDRLVIPLRPALDSGSYSVRWSVVSDDGHEEEGVIVFGIGTGAKPAVLTTRGYVTWQRVIMRTLLLLGVLGAAGAAFFSVAVLGGALPKRQAHLLFAFFLLAFAGADALIHATSTGGTRFERFMIVATVASGIGAAAAALAPLEGRLRFVVWGAAAVLFVCPTLAGHALDADQPAVIAPAADLLHLGGAAVWLGGVASLVLARTGTVQRFAQFALPAVAVVALGGAARALTELSSVSQVWTTGYGRALVIKTAIFAALLTLAWLGRRGLLVVQLALLAGLAVTVGALTDLRPGRARSAVSSVQPSVPQPPAAPPSRAYVDAGQAGPLAVGFAWLDGKVWVTLVGQDGGVVTNVPVQVASTGRLVHIAVAGTNLQFAVPATLDPAAAALRRARNVYDAARALTIVERLSSRPGISQTSVFHERAPDRLAYRIVASTEPGLAGRQAVVIGARRWDRSGRGPWRRSSYGQIRVPLAYWGPHPQNAYYSAPNVVTFFDPRTHAWFRLQLDSAGRPAELTMTAGAHFMHHDYSFRSPEISPPSR